MRPRPTAERGVVDVCAISKRVPRSASGRRVRNLPSTMRRADAMSAKAKSAVVSVSTPGIADGNAARGGGHV